MSENNRIPKITISDYGTFYGRSKHLYHIRTEQNEILGFTPNEAQIRLDKIRKEEFERNKSIKGVEQAKIILLKGRQVGGTTETACFNFDTMQRIPNARGLVLAHDDKSTPVIYEKYRIIYKNLPDIIEIVNDDGSSRIQPNGQPEYVRVRMDHESFSGYQLKFSEGTESSFLVRTAGSGDNVGKGDTLNFCHFSEAANYEHFNDVLSSVNQSMPKSAFIYSIIESTANGVSGTGEGYYKMWMKSVAEWERFEKGITTRFDGYRPVFIPWYELEKYKSPLLNGKLIDIESINFHTPEYKKEFFEMEEKIVEEVFKDNKEKGLEAINWYRWCIKENCQYDILSAKRYYPTVPEDAFLSTDVSFFNSAKMFQVMKVYEQKDPTQLKGIINKQNEFEENPFGELTIWELPKPHWHDRYVVSLDPSYGIEQGDYACMFVFDRVEKRFVAKWYGNQKEDILAEEMSKLGYFYNNALLVPEVNLRTVVTLIRPNGMIPYEGRIYTYAVKSRNGAMEYGYHTYGPNRGVLLNNYNRWLRDDYFKIPDLESLKEHITFVKKVTRQTPKYEAAEGMFDDQVIAMALCIEGDSWWDDEPFLADSQEKDIIEIYNNTAKKRKFLRLSQLS